MTIMQSENHEISTGAARMRRYREQKRQGVVCVARVPIYQLDVETLVARKRMRKEDAQDREKINAAVEAVLDDFTERKLVPAGDE